MVYRKIYTACGTEVLQPLSEQEQAVYYRNKQNRKKKEDRESVVGAWIGSMLMCGTFFFFIITYLIGGFF